MAGNALFDVIEEILQELEGEKRAAETPGKTQHPSARVDDGTVEPREGERARENEQDVKKQGPAGTVDEHPEGEQGPEQDDVQLNIGVRKSMVGEDPAVEKDYKSTKDDTDQPTESPAQVGQEKYSQWEFSKLASEVERLGRELLAELQEPNQSADDQEKAAEQAGYEAALAAEQADALIERAVRNVMEKAAADAEAVADFLAGFQEGQEEQDLEKQAADQDISDEEYKSLLDWLTVGAYHGDEESAKLAADLIQADPYRFEKLAEDTVLGQLLAQGAPPVPPEGAPASAAEGEGPEATEAEEEEGSEEPEEGEGPEAEGEGEVSPEEAEQALDELAAALVDMGISPEELAQAAEKMSQWGRPHVEQRGRYLMKVAEAVQERMRSGGFTYREPKTAQERRLREEMKQYIREATRLI